MTGRITSGQKVRGDIGFFRFDAVSGGRTHFSCASTSAGMVAIPGVVYADVPARAAPSEGATRPARPRSKGEGSSRKNSESPSAPTGWSPIPTGRHGRVVNKTPSEFR